MIKKRGYLALVLARKGSRRLKNKNILKLGSKPLISWTLSSLKKNKDLFDDVLVSSNSDKIKKITEKYGFLFIKRPNYLSKNTTSSEDSAIHAINYYRKINYKIKYVILFQPTSPFRNNSTIKKTFKLSLKYPNKQIITVNQKDLKANGSIYISPIKILKKFISFSNKNYIPMVIKSKKESIDINSKKDFIEAKKFLNKKF